MTIVKKFIEENHYGHHDRPRLQGYIYKNVLPERLFQQLKKEIHSLIDNKNNKATFLTAGTIMYHEGKRIKQGINIINNRFQNVLFDIMYVPDYYYQTESTIKDWIDNHLTLNISPIFLKYLLHMKTLEPFNTDKYLPVRLHINYLPHDDTEMGGLTIHLDSNNFYSKYELYETNMLSLTFYADTQPENTGGELYSINGFTYRPVENTALAINGSQVLHGVTQNRSGKSRLAFTTRWMHIDEMYLPGHPDKFLYKIDL